MVYYCSVHRTTPMSKFSLSLYQYKSISNKIDRLTTAELDLIIILFFTRLRVDKMFLGLFSRGMGVTYDVFGMVLKEQIIRKHNNFFNFKSKTFNQNLYDTFMRVFVN